MGLFGVHLLILHFKFQFSKSIKSSAFYIFLNLTYPLRENIFSQNAQMSPRNLQNRQTKVNEISRGIWRCLKRDRDIGRKAVLSDVNNSFHVYLRLNTEKNLTLLIYLVYTFYPIPPFDLMVSFSHLH